MVENQNSDTYLELAADIVSAYVSNNALSVHDLPNLIGNVHGTLLKISNGKSETALEIQKPAVPVKKSITPDYIV